jgi:hypothetical protein
MPFFNSSFDENWYGDQYKGKKPIQYFMYGLLVLYKKYIEKFGELKSNDDIHGIFRGRDGEFLIIGKVLEKINDDIPIIVPKLEEVDKLIIEASVEKEFGFKGEFHYYFVTINK